MNEDSLIESVKRYQLHDSCDKKELIFNTSENNHIDALKYNLFHLIYNDKIDCLNLTDRIDILNDWLIDLKYNHHSLHRRELQTGCKPECEIFDIYSGTVKSMINLASNDYLNLSQHPKVIDAAIKGLKKYGAGSGGAPIASGTLKISSELETKLAQIKGCDDALLFNSGYSTNLGVITSLLREKDVAIIDVFAHASLHDGAALTNKHYFLHNNLDSLEKELKKVRSQYVNKLVIVDGVYSMDGDIAPLDKIVEIAHQHGAWVLVDEAHATGVLGKTGKGTIEHFGLEKKIDVVTGTLSKAIGCSGGFVAGSKELINYIVFASRPFVFSTASFVPVHAAAIESLRIIEEEPEIRQKLWENIRYMQDNLRNMKFNLANSETAIIPLIIGDDLKVKEMGYQLHKSNIFVNAVPYPAVPLRQTRIRLSITAGHSHDQLSKSLAEIERIGKELKIIP